MANDKISFGECVKAAFNLTVPIGGKMGGIPINYVYLAVATGATIAFPPAALFAVAGEIGYLWLMANNPSFQNVVRSQRRANDEIGYEQSIEDMVARLSIYGLNYESFSEKCDDILQVAKNCHGVDEGDIETYKKQIRHLRMIMAKLYISLEMAEKHYDPDGERKIRGRIGEIQFRIDANHLPETTLKSENGKIEILKQRLELQREIEERIKLLKSEVERVEENIQLLNDQILMLRNPSVLSDILDTTTETIRSHFSWLEDQDIVATSNQLTVHERMLEQTLYERA